MNATIERELSIVLPGRQRAHGTTLPDGTEGYKAPLATFLVLVASARASAQAVDDAVQERTGLLVGPRS